MGAAPCRRPRSPRRAPPADAMVAERWIELDEDAGVITPAGLRHLANLGIDLDPSPARKARAVPLCRPCLDWSERRLHVAGRLGAALCTTARTGAGSANVRAHARSTRLRHRLSGV